MNTATRTQFTESEHAALYNKYRPKADPKVLQRILTYLKEKKREPLNIAVDVACGSGQGTIGLAPHFKKVIGYDISTAQVNEGNRTNTADNIEYQDATQSSMCIGHTEINKQFIQYCKLSVCVVGLVNRECAAHVRFYDKYGVADAENISMPDNSVDLVTCSQAAHWFDFSKFFREVDRILTPNGVLAVYSRGDYVLVHPDEETAKELTKIYKECTWKTLAAYWNDPVHATRQNGYVDLDIPYPDFERVTMESQMPLTLTKLTGFISSFTAYQRFHKENPNDDIFTPLHARFLQALKSDGLPEETEVTTSCPLSMLLGRKPDSN